jgi:hypothetical protein
MPPGTLPLIAFTSTMSTIRTRSQNSGFCHIAASIGRHVQPRAPLRLFRTSDYLAHCRISKSRFSSSSGMRAINYFIATNLLFVASIHDMVLCRPDTVGSGPG